MKHKIIIAGPKSLSELFQFVAISREAQFLISELPILDYYLKLPLKTVQYNSEFKNLSHIFIKFPKNGADRAIYLNLENIKISEADNENLPYIEQEGRSLRVSGGNKSDVSKLTQIWEEAKKQAKNINQLNSLVNIVFSFLFNKHQNEIKLPFPVLRNKEVNVYAGGKKELHKLIQEELRQRYESNRDISKIKPKIIFSVSIQGDLHTKAYTGNSWIQLPKDGDVSLKRLTTQICGYQLEEYLTSADLFVETINIIGQQALPYTIYFISNIGSSLYKTRDYFISIYPGLKTNFVGVSTPPIGFVNNNAKMRAICEDIEKKKPDLIVSGLNRDINDSFSTELTNRKVNFGIFLSVGNAIELGSGNQNQNKTRVTRVFKQILKSLKNA